MQPPRLAHLFVFTSDLERMAALYAAALGLRRENSANAGFVIMRADVGADVALHQLPPHIAAEVAITSPPRWRDDTALKMAGGAELIAGGDGKGSCDGDSGGPAFAMLANAGDLRRDRPTGLLLLFGATLGLATTRRRRAPPRPDPGRPIGE